MATRREVLLALGALALLPACGGDDDGMTPTDGGGGGACSSTTSTIDSNHGHSLSVPGAHVSAGTARTYDIMGSSGHTHSVSLSATDFANLQSDGMVVVNSTSGGGHTHAVTVRCA